MAFVVLAYGLIAAATLAAGLASAPLPRSALLITSAALLWPFTMAAVAVQALLMKNAQSDWTLSSEREKAGGRSGPRPATMSGWPAV